jgi:hypothetical protein
MEITNHLRLKQCYEMAVLLALAMVLAGLLVPGRTFFWCAAAVLTLALVFPSAFRPLVFLWFSFSRILSGVFSTLLLSLVFFALVVPVGYIRKALGYDTFRLKGFKKSSDSVFTPREKLFNPEDFIRQF